jgi:hypothetical protein
MSTDREDPPVSGQARTGAFRHLPEPVRLEETVSTTRGNATPELLGEPNAFIAAAVHAGG